MVDTTGSEDISTSDNRVIKIGWRAVYNDSYYLRSNNSKTISYMSAPVPVDAENPYIIIEQVYIDKKLNRWDLMDLD